MLVWLVFVSKAKSLGDCNLKATLSLLFAIFESILHEITNRPGNDPVKISWGSRERKLAGSGTIQPAFLMCCDLGETTT